MLLNNVLLRKVVKDTLREDAAGRDITTRSFIPRKTRVEARIIAKDDGVVCGLTVAAEVFKAFDKTLLVKLYKKDGHKVKKGEAVIFLKGKARSVLSCERVALNFLSYLSGISTETAAAVAAVKGQGIQILDTRKTTPLLRTFEKYAVLMGGGKNHRFDLSGQYLVKDNHVFILKTTKGFAQLARRNVRIPFEIEVEDFHELRRVMFYRPDIIMLDNFLPSDIRKAVDFIRKVFPNGKKRPLIELSGGITPGNIKKYAIGGVDFISLGTLTHSPKALDFSLEITKVL